MVADELLAVGYEVTTGRKLVLPPSNGLWMLKLKPQVRRRSRRLRRWATIR